MRYYEYEREYDYSHENYDRAYSDECDYGYSRDDLDRMYRDAFEGDPEAYWNID